VKLEIVYADVEWIAKALHGVKVTIVEGALLTIFIVFLFLHSWRSTIITGLTLPISVIATFTAVYMFGFTLNFITLMALSLCIGLLIDDAIVVRENIVRHLGMGKDHHTAAREGTDEIGLAVMATTFAIIAVFVPVAFMKGIIGRFFFQFGITVAVAVAVSLFVSFTLDPMLSAVWRDPAETRFKYAPWLGRVMMRIEHAVEKAHVVYGKLLEWALINRKKVLALAFAVFVGSFFILPLVGTEFFPDSDEGRTSFRITTPVGSSLAYTDSKVRQVEEVIRTYPEVEMMVANVGTWEGRNVGRVDVRLSEKNKRPDMPVKTFEKKVRDKLRSMPGIELAVGYNRPIWINLLGPSPEGLEDLTNEILAKMAKIKGITDLESRPQGAEPCHHDEGEQRARQRPGPHGVADRCRRAPVRRRRRDQPLARARRAELRRERAAAQVGPAHRPPTWANSTSPARAPTRTARRCWCRCARSWSSRIPPARRSSSARSSSAAWGLYANVEGRPAGDVGKDVQALLKTIQLPPGYRFDIAGDQQQMEESFNAAVAALGMAIIFIYLILASQFGSFMQPVAIMASLPFTLIGVFLALLVTGSTLNMFSIIGIIMLMGLVTKNAILLVDFTNQGLREGLSRHDAILAAGQVRLRPILMTTLAMIFGMLPMAIGSADGGEQNAPMGRAVIGGVITSTLLTLVVVPVIYTYLDTWGRWIKARLVKPAPAGGGAEVVHASPEND
jgi:multidrug efflux pump subunit AcrB